MKHVKKLRLTYHYWTTILAMMVFAQPVAAQDKSTNDKILDNLGTAAKQPFGATSGRTTITPGQIVGDIVKTVLTFTGTVAFLIFLYGGFLWLTARGNEDQVGKAKKFLTNGLIGTVVIILAYSVTYFITDVVFRATTGSAG